MLMIFVILGLVGAVFGQSTTVSTCNNNAPLPLHVEVEGCQTPPCALPQLSDAVINIVFRNTKLVRSLRARAVAYLAFLPITHDLGDQSDGCRGLTNSYCPLMEGEVLQYTLKMFIEAYFPVGVSVNLEFSLLDDAGGALFCIRFGLSVVDPIDNRAANSTLTLT